MRYLVIFFCFILLTGFKEPFTCGSANFAIIVKNMDGTVATDVQPNTSYIFIAKGPLSGNVAYCFLSQVNFTGVTCKDATNGTITTTITTTSGGTTISGSLAPVDCQTNQILTQFAVSFNFN